jgi:transcriptional regulator with XRE-family HTH domain
MNFRQTLAKELGDRRRRNPGYSLRAFARDLGTDHSTLSQILRGRRGLSSRMISRFGGQLRLHPTIIVDASVEQNAETILRLARTPGFHTHSRWIAARTNIPLDAVNVALHRLLYQGDLLMKSANRWKATH